MSLLAFHFQPGFKSDNTQSRLPTNLQAFNRRHMIAQWAAAAGRIVLLLSAA